MTVTCNQNSSERLSSIPWGFSQIQGSHFVDKQPPDLSLLGSLGHFYICQSHINHFEQMYIHLKKIITEHKLLKITVSMLVCDWHLRFGLLPIKRIDLRLHQHIGKHQIPAFWWKRGLQKYIQIHPCQRCSEKAYLVPCESWSYSKQDILCNSYCLHLSTHECLHGSMERKSLWRKLRQEMAHDSYLRHWIRRWVPASS